MKNLDIIVYGATGFTGSLCVKYLNKKYSNIKWAIAGRNKSKLIKLSEKFDLKCEIFVADCHDINALNSITSKTRVIISTAGPFHKYGSSLVASCIKNNTDYVDITGETFWIKELIDKYHDQAREKSIRIIPSCGFDSVPSDIGVYYAINEFGSKVKSIDLFYKWKGEASGGTIETMFSIKDVKNKSSFLGPFTLTPKKLITEIQIKETSDKVLVTKNQIINAWTAPFIMAVPNASIVRRSAALFKEMGQSYGKNFIYKEHAYYSNRYLAYLGTLFLIIFGIVVYSPLRILIRPLLRKPGQGPSSETMDGGFIKAKIIVKGEDDHKKLYELYGNGDPGYKLTSMFVCESACSLLEDKNTLPGGVEYGGILTPSLGLGNILIDRLQKAGILFKNIS